MDAENTSTEGVVDIKVEIESDNEVERVLNLYADHEIKDEMVIGPVVYKADRPEDVPVHKKLKLETTDEEANPVKPQKGMREDNTERIISNVDFKKNSSTKGLGLSRLRSVSGDGRRSRSTTPQPQQHGSQRPSTARRALLMGLALSGPHREPQPDIEPPPKSTARAIPGNRTPGGSVRVTGDNVAVAKTPGGHLRLVRPSVPPMCVNVLERVEALDMSDEDAEELMRSAPEHMKRWFEGLARCEEGDMECSSAVPLSLSNAAEVQVGDDLRIARPETSNAQSAPNASSADADVRPSTSGMAATSKQIAKELLNDGSDLDSDFDDEFVITDEFVVRTVDVPASVVTGRNIPENDELEEPVQEIIAEVERAMDDEADRLLGTSNSFEWVSDFNLFRAEPERFSGPTPGPIKNYDTPYEAFADIWSNDFIERIVQETNRYAKQTIDSLKAAGSLKTSSRYHQWKDTDVDEIMVLFAIYIYMGIDIRTSQIEYWSTGVLGMPKFREIMSFNRYILLNKFIHFVDNTDPGQRDQPSGPRLSVKLFQLSPVITHLNSKFVSLYNLQREIAIDESLTLFKGRLSWVQAIRTKAARFGIKSYELCESHTGYLYKFEIYTGKDSGDASTAADVPLSADLGGKSTKVVLDLLKGLEHLGHQVTMDNFYNSPSLARYLKSIGFDCLGTLRLNRKNVPNEVAKIPKNVANGTIIARHCGDVSVVAWKDSKVVTMISTYHNDETYVGTRAGKVLVKPVSVKDYNSTMGGVDLKDQKLSMYLLERKRGVKWYMKMFKRLLNVSIHNALVLHNKSMTRRGKVYATHRDFRYELAASLLQKHRHVMPKRVSTGSEIMRLRRDIVHKPLHVARNNRKRCVVCYRNDIDKKVRSLCQTCDVGLCFEDCWEEWHSLTTLKGQDRGSRKRKRSS